MADDLKRRPGETESEHMDRLTAMDIEDGRQKAAAIAAWNASPEGLRFSATEATTVEALRDVVVGVLDYLIENPR